MGENHPSSSSRPGWKKKKGAPGPKGLSEVTEADDNRPSVGVRLAMNGPFGPEATRSARKTPSRIQIVT